MSCVHSLLGAGGTWQGNRIHWRLSARRPPRSTRARDSDFTLRAHRVVLTRYSPASAVWPLHRTGTHSPCGHPAAALSALPRHHIRAPVRLVSPCVVAILAVECARLSSSACEQGRQPGDQSRACRCEHAWARVGWQEGAEMTGQGGPQRRDRGVVYVVGGVRVCRSADDTLRCELSSPDIRQQYPWRASDTCFQCCSNVPCHDILPPPTEGLQRRRGA